MEVNQQPQGGQAAIMARGAKGIGKGFRERVKKPKVSGKMCVGFGQCSKEEEIKEKEK